MRECYVHVLSPEHIYTQFRFRIENVKTHCSLELYHDILIKILTTGFME